VLLTGAVCGDDELDDLTRRLRQRDKWERKAAIEGLARLGTPPAWELVIEALADERGEVADTAQWVLAELQDPKLLKRLVGREGLRSKDPWIRERVTELFGRMELFEDVRSLIGQLDDREPGVRRAAYLALEARVSTMEQGGRERVAKAARRRRRSERDPALRARALALQVACTGDLELLLEAARDREPAHRAMAAHLLRRFPDEGARRDTVVLLLDQALEDEHRSVRFQAVESAARLASRESVRLLVERLGHEEHPRLEHRIVQVLQVLSGQKHRRDPRPWRDWLARLDEGWRGRFVPASTTRRAAGQGRSAVATALPVLSERISFLIDLSGSIWLERDDGKTRKERVDEKLREALGRLHEDARFNVVPFTSMPIPWKERLMKANRRNVTGALRFFDELRVSGSGNIFDAVQLALRDPELDTLVLLTDGAPTGGRRHRLELILPWLLRQNESRGVHFDVVLVGASRRLEGLWRRLTDGSAGELVTLDLQ